MSVDVISATNTYSGYNFSNSGVYSTARSDLAGSGVGTTGYVGQFYDAGSGYYCYQTPLMFDTSVVGTDAISYAILSLWLATDSSTTDLVVQARAISSYASLAASWVAGASLSGQTLLAHISTSGIGATGAYKTLTDDAMPANINKTGTTYLLLSSDRHAAGNTPTGSEFVIFDSANYTGTTRDPYLTITHAPAGFLAKVWRSGGWTTGYVQVRRSGVWVTPTGLKVRRSGGWT